MFQRRVSVGNKWAAGQAGLENWERRSRMEIFKSDVYCVDQGGAVSHLGGMQVIVAVVLVGQKDWCVLRSGSLAQGLVGFAGH